MDHMSWQLGGTRDLDKNSFGEMVGMEARWEWIEERMD